MFEFLADANKFIFENAANYGSIFTANIFSRRLTFLLDIRDLQAMSKNTNLVFSGDEMVSHIQEGRRCSRIFTAFSLFRCSPGHFPNVVPSHISANSAACGNTERANREVSRTLLSNAREGQTRLERRVASVQPFEASTRSLFGSFEHSQLQELEKNFLAFNDKFHLFFCGLPSWFYKLFYRGAYNGRQRAGALLFETRTDESPSVSALREQYQER